MRKFTYLVPKNLNEAISMHESHGGRAKYMAGGTDVLVKIKEGKLNGLKQHSQKMIELIQAEKPGTVVFLQYFNEQATELSIIHVFPDADAYNRHGEGVAERARAAFEFIERTRIEIYGMPGDQNLAMLRPSDGSEITFKHMPQLNGGCIRLKPG